MLSDFLKSRIVEAVRKDPTISIEDLRERFYVSADVIARALKKANVVRTPITIITTRETNGVLKKAIRKIKGAPSEGHIESRKTARTGSQR